MQRSASGCRLRQFFMCSRMSASGDVSMCGQSTKNSKRSSVVMIGIMITGEALERPAVRSFMGGELQVFVCDGKCGRGKFLAPTFKPKL